VEETTLALASYKRMHQFILIISVCKNFDVVFAVLLVIHACQIVIHYRAAPACMTVFCVIVFCIKAVFASRAQAEAVQNIMLYMHIMCLLKLRITGGYEGRLSELFCAALC